MKREDKRNRDREMYKYRKSVRKAMKKDFDPTLQVQLRNVKGFGNYNPFTDRLWEEHY